MADHGLMSQICSAVADILASRILEDQSSLLSISESLTSNKAFMDKLVDHISPKVTDSLDKANEHNADIALQKCDDLENSYKKLKKRVDTQEKQLDDLEQYSRRNCLLIHGIAEAGIRGENTDQVSINTINQHLNINIDNNDIDRSHRIGKPKSTDDEDNKTTKPRPVMVKFISYARRAQVFRAKRKLKGSGLLITESLTRTRMDLLRQVHNHPTVTNSWTSDGTIHCIDTVGKRRTITGPTDLEKF